MTEPWHEQLKWPASGLLPAIAQDAETGRVLMLAWMSPESLQATLSEGIAVYWSRSRKKLWRKGEQSGHRQKIQEIRLDCDRDAILLKVTQQGGIACHTGRASCFYSRLENEIWVDVDPVLKKPSEIYP